MKLHEFRHLLGAPAYEDDDVLLYCGDSLELLAELPAESLSLTVTSPPYNIGKEYESVKQIEEYIQWTKEWTSSVHRITNPAGAMWLNLGYISHRQIAKAIPIPYLVWKHIPFFLIQEIVWNYGAGVAGRTFFSPRNEKFLWYVKDDKNYTFNLDAVRDPNVKYPHQKKNGKLKCNPLGKNPSDVWQVAKVTSGANRSSRERTPHPAQFPLALVARIILASSDPGQIILDPFVGSGSLIDAAIRKGRKAVGIEINSTYVDIAVARIKAARLELREIASQADIFGFNITT